MIFLEVDLLNHACIMTRRHTLLCVCVCGRTDVKFIGYFVLFRLIEAKDVVYECGPNCGCGPACVNRVSQRGIKYRLEVVF